MQLAPDLLARLAGREPVLVLAGAGLSAASGVPTFRAAQTGLWAKFRPEELATAEAYQRDPKTVWQWYVWRRELIQKAQPNAAHHALTTWQKQRPVTIVTQNVDGLQARAGGDAIEFHGNIERNLCFDEHRVLTDDDIIAGEPPTCRHCNAYARPGVVWFGEAIPEYALLQANQAAEQCHTVVSVGTSSLVYPANALVETALRAGAAFVEINPEQTPVSSLADYRLAAGAEEVLPRLIEALGFNE
ncbi:MAG: NAD-dependent deacetylase [Gammaproteobacteria bacterium]